MGTILEIYVTKKLRDQIFKKVIATVTLKKGHKDVHCF